MQCKGDGGDDPEAKPMFHSVHCAAAAAKHKL
jgi:hypothetical protein